MDFKDLGEKEQLEALLNVSEKVYKMNMEYYTGKGVEISNVSYSKTENGEVVFEIELTGNGETYNEYYSQSLDLIMAEYPIINQNIINKSRTDLETIEKQEQFKEEVEKSEDRVDARKIIEEKNKKIDEVSKELGIDSKDIQITEIDDKSINEADKELDNKELKLDEKQKDAVERNALALDANEKITERSTANKVIGGDYSKYLFIQSNGTYNLFGEKADGTIEKVTNVLDMRPHTANVVRADGEFVPTRMETGFMIKGDNNDVGFGITTAPNGIPRITFMRGVTTDNPIGYNIKDTTSYKQNISDKIKNIFDERNFDKRDIQEISDGIDTLDETPEEDRLNVNDFGEDIGNYYDDIAAKYNVTIEEIQKLDEQLIENGYINADTRMEIIEQTYEEEQEITEEVEEEKIEEEITKVDHGERIIEPIIPNNPFQPK